MMIDDHKCRPPEGRQPLTLQSWTCPECGTEWEASPRIDPENPPRATTYDFETAERVLKATWVRVEKN